MFLPFRYNGTNHKLNLFKKRKSIVNRLCLLQKIMTTENLPKTEIVRELVIFSNLETHFFCNKKCLYSYDE